MLQKLIQHCEAIVCISVLVIQSCLILCDPWTVAHQAPLSMEFSRRGYCWSGLPFPSPGDLPNPGIKLASPVSPALQADSLLSEPPGEPYKAIILQLKKRINNNNKKERIEKPIVCPAI